MSDHDSGIHGALDNYSNPETHFHGAPLAGGPLAGGPGAGVRASRTGYQTLRSIDHHGSQYRQRPLAGSQDQRPFVSKRCQRQLFAGTIGWWARSQEPRGVQVAVELLWAAGLFDGNVTTGVCFRAGCFSKRRNWVRCFDASRWFIERIVASPQNVNIEATQTYTIPPGTPSRTAMPLTPSMFGALEGRGGQTKHGETTRKAYDAAFVRRPHWPPQHSPDRLRFARAPGRSEALRRALAAGGEGYRRGH